MTVRNPRRLTASGVLLVGLVVVGAGVGPGLRQAGAGGEISAAGGEAKVMVVRFAGRFPNRSADPTHTTWVGEMREPATGRVLGTMTHDSYPLQPGGTGSAVLQIINTFHWPDGTIVIRGTESVVPDPLHPGFFLVGVDPDSTAVVAATGLYAGYSGTARMAGRHDGRELPSHATFDDFWLIELRPDGHGDGRAVEVDH